MSDEQAPLSADEFKAGMDLLLQGARLINLVPIDRLLAVVTRTEDFGCFVMNPMEWQRGLPNLRDQRKLLDACAAVQKASAEIAGRAG